MNAEELMRKYHYGYIHAKKILEEDYVKELQQKNKQLREKLKATNKGLIKVLSKRLKWKRRYYKEKYIRKELKKWLEEKTQHNIPNARWKHYNEDGFNDYDMVNASAIKVQPVNVTLKEVLDKIKELEEGVK